MAKVKITYDYNNKTGKRIIHIDLKSDPDSLANEHENLHRKIVKELVGKGVLSKEDAENVVIDRPEPEHKEKKKAEEERIPNAERKNVKT
jgi:hypothetical protein